MNMCQHHWSIATIFTWTINFQVGPNLLTKLFSGCHKVLILQKFQLVKRIRDITIFLFVFVGTQMSTTQLDFKAPDIPFDYLSDQNTLHL